MVPRARHAAVSGRGRHCVSFSRGPGQDEGAVDCTVAPYAIQKVHRLLSLPDHTYHEDTNLTFPRIRRAKPIRPKQAKRLTREYLDAFIESEPDKPWGLRNRAMLSFGSELLTRRSELVALRTDDLEFRCDGTLRVLIQRSKADPFGNGRVVFTSVETANPVRNWLNRRGPQIPWLFYPIYRGKPINRGLEVTTVKSLLKTALKRSGMAPDDIHAFIGHSLRVGAAQDLLSSGHDTAAIKRAGGWKYVNVLARYLENAEYNVWAQNRAS